jgi:ATP-dependent DNA ligase
LKTLAELQAECARVGIAVSSNGRPSREPYVVALRTFHWEHEHPGEPLPRIVEPMLLANWNDLDGETASELEADLHAWIVQEKHDGVRALLHVEKDGVRITGRSHSDVTHRPLEHQENLPHLTEGLGAIEGTILDGELVCPRAEVHTGKRLTTSALQATVAVLATRPENAARIQANDAVKLRLHVFDVLEHAGRDVTALPLVERLGLLNPIAGEIDNPFIEVVPSYVVNKRAIHDTIIDRGGEGAVWKRADQPYEPGRRVKHWIKRKRDVEVEAFVSAFKPGSPGRGHGHLVGAVEFSIEGENGQSRPIAWVSSWTDEERDGLTWRDREGNPTLDPTSYGRRAIVVGQDESGRSGRLRHARLRRWTG